MLLNVLKKSFAITEAVTFHNPVAVIQQQPFRQMFEDWRTKKDNRKRQTVKKYAIERLRINSLRKNDILPLELREIADKEIAEMPIDGSITRLVPRCQITSRPRGIVYRYRISRIVFRHLADYNKLYGVQRAMW